MKQLFLAAGLALSITGAAFAQSNSTSGKQTAATEKATAASTSGQEVNATCKDGTPYSGKTLRGACRGHGGVDKEKSAKQDGSGSQPASSKTGSDSTGGKSKTSSAGATPTSAAAGGGAGKVWANEDSKVYHCSGDRYYGKTKKGEYMSEADAKQKGFRPDHGKACGS